MSDNNYHQFNKINFFFDDNKEKNIKNNNYPNKKLYYKKKRKRNKKKNSFKNIFKIPEYKLNTKYNFNFDNFIKEKSVKILPNFRFLSFKT